MIVFHFSNAKSIIDCVEFKVLMVSSHKMLYSDYNIHTTVKVLLDIMPGCGSSFLSSALCGGDSVKSITVKIAVLNTDLREPGNELYSRCQIKYVLMKIISDGYFARLREH